MRNYASPERRMRKWILVYSVPVYQSTSGLMEEARVHRNARHIRTKSRLPDAAGQPSTEGKTSPHSSGQRMSNPHASPLDDPDRPGPSPSTPRTTQPGNATTEPTPDINLACVHPRPNQTPGHCGGTPGQADFEHPYGGAPLPGHHVTSF